MVVTKRERKRNSREKWWNGIAASVQKTQRIRGSPRE
jgi:hypothetical protein